MDIRDLKKEIWKTYNERSVWTQKSDVDKFKKLLDELDDVNKVTLPKRIADWIREAAQPSNLTTVSVMHRDAIRYGKHIDWFRKPDNQRLLLKALLYGYEVEKEPRYRIKLPGLAGNNGQQYISKSADGKLFACARRDYLQQEFTNDELKQLPDWIRRLELEEVGRK